MRDYKIRCITTGKIFDTLEELCEHYNMTKDQVAYRLDKKDDYKDGMKFERIMDNTEALQTVKAVDSRKFVEKYGEKTVPLPGYEDKYTISTRGVITNTKHFNKVVPVKTTVNVKHTVILHSSDNKITQTASLTNLMKRAFGDPENDWKKPEGRKPGRKKSDEKPNGGGKSSNETKVDENSNQ